MLVRCVVEEEYVQRRCVVQENVLEEGVTGEESTQEIGIKKRNVAFLSTIERPCKWCNMRDIENEEDDKTRWLEVVRGPIPKMEEAT